MTESVHRRVEQTGGSQRIIFVRPRVAPHAQPELPLEIDNSIPTPSGRVTRTVPLREWLKDPVDPRNGLKLTEID